MRQLNSSITTFVTGTHERKRSWSQGRRDDAYIAETYPNSIWPVTGKAGDLIAADTIGLHKGERVQVAFEDLRLGEPAHPSLTNDSELVWLRSHYLKAEIY